MGGMQYKVVDAQDPEAAASGAAQVFHKYEASAKNMYGDRSEMI